MDPLRDLKAFDPTKKVFSLWEEFKAFAFKGNVIDLAVGVIIAAAFGKIIESLVKNILMPVISLAMPTDTSYKDWKWVFGEDGKKVIPYGAFLEDVVTFVIVSVAIFLFIVKFLGWILRSRKAAADAPPPPLSKQEQLLTEIRDLLKTPPADRVG